MKTPPLYNSNINQTDNKSAAKGYLKRYIKELKVHFNLTDCDLRKIIQQIHSETAPKGLVKKWFDMLKLIR